MHWFFESPIFYQSVPFKNLGRSTIIYIISFLATSTVHPLPPKRKYPQTIRNRCKSLLKEANDALFSVSDPEVFSDAEKLLISLVNILQSGQTVDAGLTLQDQSELMKIEVIS